ncbi:TetR/AcrR family transcriptional regulator [Pukyongiella litopenaei]|uniref:TetR/AcrR family transcriptional regulator n=1 Tax=Pukyongiella litopenaei TaxID=2605946 RepID=A0A2S0MRZ7_9RHOB|nr:TetR/AcrR family transcriptional regulator [Pukyongiella litopenaei]AVO38669.1 TetR/AcrR family transcriptional regulator [Pukyongiella litopenaei]
MDVEFGDQAAHDPAARDKQAAILDAALAVFARYGFRRTAMADIAREAGMSRAALYLHYRNKEDIFRSLSAAFYDRAAQDVAAALEAEGPADAVLCAAFEAYGGAAFVALLSSPHGEELLDTKANSAADIAREGEARIVGLFAQWLERRGVDDPAETAVVILAAKHGLKSIITSPQDYRAKLSRLARLIGNGLGG